MKYKNEEYRRREMRAQKAAVNLVRRTNYRIVGEPALLPLALRDGLNAPDVNLVILPSGGDHPFKLQEAVIETRTSVLLIEPGVTMDGAATFYFTLIRCMRGEIHRHRGLRLWLDIDGHGFLVPGHLDESDGQHFVLGKLDILNVPAPWRGEVDREFGLKQADAMLLAP